MIYFGHSNKFLKTKGSLRQKVTQIKTENHHDKRELKEKDQ